MRAADTSPTTVLGLRGSGGCGTARDARRTAFGICAAPAVAVLVPSPTGRACVEVSEDGENSAQSVPPAAPALGLAAVVLGSGLGPAYCAWHLCYIALPNRE